MPLSASTREKNASSAWIPPADAPIPTTGNGKTDCDTGSVGATPDAPFAGWLPGPFLLSTFDPTGLTSRALAPSGVHVSWATMPHHSVFMAVNPLPQATS